MSPGVGGGGAWDAPAGGQQPHLRLPCWQAAASGLIINTMGWIDGLGYDLLLHSIKALKADTVLVVGNEKLYSQLSRHFEVGGAGVGGLPSAGCASCLYGWDFCAPIVACQRGDSAANSLPAMLAISIAGWAFHFAVCSCER